MPPPTLSFRMENALCQALVAKGAAKQANSCWKSECEEHLQTLPVEQVGVFAGGAVQSMHEVRNAGIPESAQGDKEQAAPEHEHHLEASVSTDALMPEYCE